MSDHDICEGAECALSGSFFIVDVEPNPLRVGLIPEGNGFTSAAEPALALVVVEIGPDVEPRVAPIEMRELGNKAFDLLARQIRY